MCTVVSFERMKLKLYFSCLHSCEGSCHVHFVMRVLKGLCADVCQASLAREGIVYLLARILCVYLHCMNETQPHFVVKKNSVSVNIHYTFHGNVASRVKCFWFSFVCSVLTCLVGQEQIYFSSDWQQRYCPVFSGLLWFFYISQVVSLTLHLPLFLVLGQSCLAFHHVRLQS